MKVSIFDENGYNYASYDGDYVPKVGDEVVIKRNYYGNTKASVIISTMVVDNDSSRVSMQVICKEIKKEEHND